MSLHEINFKTTAICKKVDPIKFCAIRFFIFKGIAVPCCDTYGKGSGMILIRDVTCDGSETNVTSCIYLNNTVLRSHQQDVGVQCEQGESNTYIKEIYKCTIYMSVLLNS